MSLRILAVLAALALAGCATCERHRVACTVGAVIVAGSIAAYSANHNGGSSHDVPSPRGPNCQANPESCR